MKLAEFQHLIDSRGSDLSAWPDELRIAAERLLAAEPLAQARLREAQRLDDFLARALKVEPASLAPAVARVLARLPRELPRQRRFALSWPMALLDADLAPSRLRIAALAGVACLGVVLGLFGPDVDARDARFVVAASAEPDLSAVFEPEALTGVRP
jgi:hypothetical protein